MYILGRDITSYSGSVLQKGSTTVHIRFERASVCPLPASLLQIFVSARALPWWSDEADHARWEDERLAAMRLGYGLDDLD